MTAAQIRPLLHRLSPRLSPQTLTALTNDVERILTRSPVSAYAIPSDVRYDPHVMHSNPAAVLRSIGTSRRVFLLKSSFTPEEIGGLSYRIRTLSSNDGINSILMANPTEDVEVDGNMIENSTCLPYFMEEGEGLRESTLDDTTNASWGSGGGGNKTYVSLLEGGNVADRMYGVPYVCMGYDARTVYESGMCRRRSDAETRLLDPIVDWVEAMRGDYDETEYAGRSKVPVISFTHGLTTDAGYALLSGSYALTTDATAYRILNPLRGLTLDPVGLSYLLPRCGRYFRQTPVMEHGRGCALLLALAGYEADASDLVSTGLATHYVGSPYKLNALERGLMNLNSHDGQALKRNPKKLYGQQQRESNVVDVNDPYRNVVVGNLIQSVSEYDAAGADEYGAYLKDDLDEETSLFLKEKDPSLRMSEERIQMYGEIVSPLVCWSATFAGVWEENSVEGIMERLREIAATKSEFEGRSGYEEDVEVAEMAGYFVSCMEQRSPLALRVTYDLLSKGGGEDESWTSCMQREKTAQLNLMTRKDGDFARWAESGLGVGLTNMEGKASLIRKTDGVFTDWKHASVKDVSDDEVSEIVRDG